MRTWKKFSSVVISLASVIALSSSVVPTSVSAASPGLVGAKNETYYMITFLSGIEYWKGVFRGMESAGKLLHVKVVYTGAPQYDINQEVTVLDQVIAKKPAGILITSMNPVALTPAINQAVSQGIPVISFDSDAPNSKRYAYLGTSNAEAGSQAATFLGNSLKGKGSVAIISTPGELNLDQRVQGFESTMRSQFPKIKVVAVENGNSNQITTAQITSTLLERYPNLSGIFATEADEGTGAATAVLEARRVGKVKIVSFDTDKATLQQIKNGQITATIAQGTWSMGYWGLMDAFMIHHNDLTPVANWKASHVDPVPPIVDTGVTVVTKQNVNAFLN